MNTSPKADTNLAFKESLLPADAIAPEVKASPKKQKAKSKKTKSKAEESMPTQAKRNTQGVQNPQNAQKSTKEVLQLPKEQVIKEQSLAMPIIEDEKMQKEAQKELIEENLHKEELPQVATSKAPKAQMPKPQQGSNRATETLAQNLLESAKNKNSNKEQNPNKNPKSTISQEIQPKSMPTEEGHIKFEELLVPNGYEEEEGFKEMLSVKEKHREKQEIEEHKAQKAQKSSPQKQHTELMQTKETSRAQVLYRAAVARENMRYFAQTLREEVANYKPPLTKLSMELNPSNLGTLELTITKKGKDLHVQVVSNATAIGLFLQNQADFKNHLTQVGFDNVDLNFSTNDNGSGTKGDEQNPNQGNHTEKRNENSLEDSKENEMHTMNITLPKYA